MDLKKKTQKGDFLEPPEKGGRRGGCFGKKVSPITTSPSGDVVKNIGRALHETKPIPSSSARNSDVYLCIAISI
jgi:hypothetical protein